ncbi:DUF2584 domain-containing protein [Bacillus aquiflavi]|uniref:DUF2584 domain-containing protein n=1 Tax=Bacillus aquiflavi TaxID=2672567 RepID=UPI001CA8BB08|nr:DUF2584 domain-containing protein [Bacillus aquiflavi]UAC47633.1 DUF2584 domain-containing protein [Bacillus aquiflavi]
MGMPIELNTLIVTKGREKREEENIFTLVKNGYRLYPIINIPIEVKKTLESDSSGSAVITKVQWENNQTMLTYQLISLKSTN